jgi:hypothetical protein
VDDVFAELPRGCGAVGLLSSDEFTPAARAFDETLLAAVRGARVGVVLCADHSHAATNLRHARAHFGDAYEVFDAVGPHEAGAPPHAPAREFDVLYMAGGSPEDLLECLRGSAFWDAVLREWRAGAALAGSSAGAMALCEHSLVPRPGDDKPTRWDRGLGPLSGVALAVHASSRPDVWLESVARAAPVPVVALDDATGVVLRVGKTPAVVGPGRARVIVVG